MKKSWLYWYLCPLSDFRRPRIATHCDGGDIELCGLSAERDDSGVHAAGWVRRRAGNSGPINAHLHVDALDTEGQTLQTIEARWMGALPTSIRSRHAATFRARVAPAISASVFSARVSVEPGPRRQAESAR